MADQSEKADALVAQAKKKLASWFASFSGNKYEDAAELLTKAANLYKASKKCEAAARAAPRRPRAGAQCLGCSAPTSAPLAPPVSPAFGGHARESARDAHTAPAPRQGTRRARPSRRWRGVTRRSSRRTRRPPPTPTPPPATRRPTRSRSPEHRPRAKPESAARPPSDRPCSLSLLGSCS
eukprot:3616040-Prymnesium_polylepis.1